MGIVVCRISRGISQSRIWKHKDNLLRVMETDPITGGVPTPFRTHYENLQWGSLSATRHDECTATGVK